MQQINIHEAKTHLSRLIEQTALGEEIVIAKHGKPVARLIPYHNTIKKRTAGSLQGQIKLSDNFDSPLPDDIAESLGML